MRPGDIVVADDDGVVVVPKGEAEAVLERALERDKREAEYATRISSGDTELFDLLGLHETALHRQNRMICSKDDLVLASCVHVMDQLGREVARSVGGGHQVEVRVLDHQADSDGPPRICTVRHHQLELGEEQTYLV